MDSGTTRWPQLAAKLHGWTEQHQVRHDSKTCTLLAWLSGLTPYRTSQGQAPSWCGFLPPERKIPPFEADRLRAEKHSAALLSYGMEIELGSCRRYSATIGQQGHDYLFCGVRLR